MIYRPGTHKDLEFYSISDTETRLIKEFAKVWFITFVKASRFKGSNFTFAFANPTSTLIERYHFERPVLIFFTPYSQFDGRSLDFVDKTIFEFQNRLDKLVILLVSRDNQIEEKVASIAVQDQESRIIVPFSYDDFENSDSEKLIHEKLRKFFFTRDLFSFNSPLKSENYFFGRANAINTFYDKYRSGENAGLFGLRKIGKTSSLYAIRRLLAVKGEPCIFVDCQDPAFHMRRWNEALEYIIKNGASQIGSNKVNNLHINKGYDEKNASTHFEEDLLTLFKEKSSKRLLIIFDEIENITFDVASSEHWSIENDFLYFWQSLRSIFQRNPALFSFIVAGVNPKCIETAQIQGKDNPIYKMIRPEYLGFFDVHQVKEMVSSIGKYMGLTFEEEVYTYLTDDYGGHPFLIRDVCSFLSKEIGKTRPAQITRHFYQENKQSLNLRLHDYLKLILDVLKSWYPLEYELLTHLAAGDYKTFNEFALELSESISHLIGYGIISAGKDVYYFNIASVKDYINQTLKLEERLASSNPDKWKFVSQKRNLLEPKLRRILLAVLIPKFGHDGAKDRFLNLVPKQRAQRLSPLSITEIMSSPESEIYLSDLKKTILKYWDYFEHLFDRDKETFDFYLTNINKHRVDAHAKELADDDYDVLLNAFKWFEKHIQNLPFIS